MTLSMYFSHITFSCYASDIQVVFERMTLSMYFSHNPFMLRVFISQEIYLIPTLDTKSKITKNLTGTCHMDRNSS